MRVSIDGYDGKYSVTDSGTVINNHSGKVLYGSPDAKGYIKVRLYKSAKVFEDKYLHRLVADGFIDIPSWCDPDSYEQLAVIHKDGNKQNNSSSNLEWMTVGESIQSARKLNKYSVADDSKKVPVVGINKLSMKFRNFDSIKEAACYIKLEQRIVSSVETIRAGISNALSGKSSFAYGYLWKYK